MSTPFKNYAPSYWSVGLPVIPLTKPMDGDKNLGKRPIHNSWSRWCTEMPDRETQQDWLYDKRAYNMGLAVGPESGIVIVDIDTMDPHLQQIVEGCLPHSPWQRIGRKGAVYAFRYNGEKTFQIKAEDGKVIVELLSQGRQVVLPPSVHPETGMPYTADRPLYECLDELTYLPPAIEDIFRTALMEQGGLKLSISGFSSIIEFVPKGTRDNRMIQEAGLYAVGIQRGQFTLKEALGFMDHWCAEYCEENKTDPIDPEKGKLRIVQFLTRDVNDKTKRPLKPGWDAGLTDQEKFELGLTFTELDEDWTFDRLQKWLYNNFTANAEDDPARMAAISQALEFMARSESMSQVERESLMGWIAANSRVRVSPSILRRMYLSMTEGSNFKGNNHSEVARSVREHMELGMNAPLQWHGGQFYHWEGSCWEVYEEWRLKKLIAEEFGHLESSVRNSDHRGILQVLQTICNNGPLRSDSEHGINFANGYLTDQLVLKPHKKEYGCTYRLTYPYKPEMEDEKNCPMFMQFLADIWGDDSDFDQKKQALREAIAITLFGQGPKYSRAIVLYNAAHGGKSTMLDIIAGLMPDGCSSHIPPSDWSDKFKPANMVGKLLNVGNDLSETAYINGEMFKIIVEGGVIQGQHKGAPIFEFRPIATHWFATNHLPQSRDSSGGFLRRWLIFKFDKKIPPEKKIVHFATKVLAAEREAIAAWAIPAIKTIAARNDFDCPHSHFDLIGEIANRSNSVRHFVTCSEKVKMTKGLHEVGKSAKTVSSGDLYKEYMTFCLTTAHKTPLNLKMFDFKLRELAPELGFKVLIHDTGVEYEGLRIVA